VLGEVDRWLKRLIVSAQKGPKPAISGATKRARSRTSQKGR